MIFRFLLLFELLLGLLLLISVRVLIDSASIQVLVILRRELLWRSGCNYCCAKCELLLQVLTCGWCNILWINRRLIIFDPLPLWLPFILERLFRNDFSWHHCLTRRYCFNFLYWLFMCLLWRLHSPFLLFFVLSFCCCSGYLRYELFIRRLGSFIIIWFWLNQLWVFLDINNLSGLSNLYRVLISRLILENFLCLNWLQLGLFTFSWLSEGRRHTWSLRLL